MKNNLDGQIRKLQVNACLHGGKNRALQSSRLAPLRALWRAQAAAHSGNPVESVVVLLVVLGTRIVEVQAMKTRFTAGFREWRPANVSSMQMTVDTCSLTIHNDLIDVLTLFSLSMLCMSPNSSHNVAAGACMSRVRHNLEIRSS